jgi:hypothetical protein
MASLFVPRKWCETVRHMVVSDSFERFCEDSLTSEVEVGHPYIQAGHTLNSVRGLDSVA